MGSSIYLGCQISDDISEATQLLKGELQQYHKDTLEELERIRPTVERILSGDDTFAQAVIGVGVNDQIRWTAKEAGKVGNEINISYIYEGPIVTLVGIPTVDPRPPSAQVFGKSIILSLAVDANGEIDATYNTSASLTEWLSNSDVSDLVSGVLVGTGADLPSVHSEIPLENGEKATMKNVEAASDDVAKIFSQKNHIDLLKAVAVPTFQTPEDSESFLNDNNAYRVINGVLLTVSGTNLIGVRNLYSAVEEDISMTRKILLEMGEKKNSPFLVVSQNVSIPRVETICGIPTRLEEISVVFRGYNTSILDIADRYAQGDFSQLNTWVFWSEAVTPSYANRIQLQQWGIPEEYLGDILAGTTPDAQAQEITLPPTEVFLVNEADIFQELGFDDDSLKKLLLETINGIEIPKKQSIEARARAFQNIIRKDSQNRENGMRSGAKKGAAASQAVDLGKSLDDSGLTKELATRGKGCARQEDKWGLDDPNLPDFDLPNMPAADLPNAAKGVEAAFGALSSVVSTANSVFDAQIKATMGIFSPLIDKLMNTNSLAENLFKNNLANCLIGTGADGVGSPELPGVGGTSTPGISIPDVIGGLPIPSSLLGDALQELSVDLDESITESFETVMKLVQKPICIVQTLLASLNGFNLDPGSLLDDLNPCKDGKDVENECPPEDVQDVINASESMTEATEQIPRLEDYPTEPFTTEVEDQVQRLSGAIEETFTDVPNEITRGVKQVMEDIQVSLDAKLEMVNAVDKAVKSLIEDASDNADTVDEDEETSSGGCGSTTVGAFTDAIDQFVG